MHVSHTVAEWRARRRGICGQSIGLVPTMGALHEGHASLVRRCRSENEITVVTIFVNPTQFNDPQDLARYPSVLEADLTLLKNLGVHEVIAPSVTELYPHGYRFKIEAPSLTNTMEGAHRPGFFEGVMTIVLKLLNLVRAGRAYFGEKDYQQLRIVTEMAAEFFLETDIIACPTVREESGLAESSRNARLSPSARKEAAVLFQALSTALTADQAKSTLRDAGFIVDYVEEHWGRRLAAASLEGVRLIDNVALPREDRIASLP